MVKLFKLAVLGMCFIMSVGVGHWSMPAAVASDQMCSITQPRCLDESAWCGANGGDFSHYGECDTCGCPYKCAWENVEAHSWCGYP
jgi:hypothetical protein